MPKASFAITWKKGLIAKNGQYKAEKSIYAMKNCDNSLKVQFYKIQSHHRGG